MNPKALIEKYYPKDSLTYTMLIAHGKAVANKAITIAKHVQKNNPTIKLNLKLIEEAAMLHDIGVQFVHAPDIGCNGKLPYVCHGYVGAELLRKEGLPEHALIAERHVGMGLSKEDIAAQKWPLPQKDMIPETWEQKIVCFTDKFYSKNKEYLTKEKPLDRVRESTKKWGTEKTQMFDDWCKIFL